MSRSGATVGRAAVVVAGMLATVAGAVLVGGGGGCGRDPEVVEQERQLVERAEALAREQGEALRRVETKLDALEGKIERLEAEQEALQGSGVDGERDEQLRAVLGGLLDLLGSRRRATGHARPGLLEQGRQRDEIVGDLKKYEAGRGIPVPSSCGPHRSGSTSRSVST